MKRLILSSINGKKSNYKLVSLPFFDEEYYLNRYPDLKNWAGKKFEHYIKFGWKELRSPNLFFDSNWYIGMNPDIALVSDPLLHYITIGEQQGRWPHPLFNPSWYLEHNPDVARTGMSPLLHFLRDGLKERREFSPFFRTNWYAQTYLTGNGDAVHPAVHFLKEGAFGEYDPGPHFSSRWYLAENPDVESAQVHPYLHYLQYGHREGRPPLPYLTGPAGSSNSYRRTLVGHAHSDIKPEDREPARANPDWSPPQISETSKIISFDVWSTLLHRECHPDEIKLQSARYLLLYSIEDLRPGFQTIQDLYRSRIRAENSSAPKGDFEYRFVDAIERWLQEVLEHSVPHGRRDKIVAGLMRHEFQAEARSTHSDEVIGNYISTLNIPYIFASDFYNSADFLRRILEKNKVGGSWMKGYASSDYFENKRSGELFKRILIDLALDPSELCHIGDNVTADKIVPESLGITTIGYESPAETKRMEWYGRAFDDLLHGDVSKHQSRIVAVLGEIAGISPANPTNEREADLFRIGVRLSPIVFSFCLSVLEDAVKRKSEKVFFFTREGQFFKKMFDAICEADPYNIERPLSSILEVSRRATFAASLGGFDVNEMTRLWSMYSSQSWRGLCSTLNLDAQIVGRVAERHGFTFDELIVYPWKNAAFIAAMQDVELLGHAKHSLAKQRELLTSYLNQEGFLSDKHRAHIVVDIGWRGTIQDNIGKLTDQVIHGHYLALFKFLNEQCEGTKIGWLGNNNVPGDYTIPDQVAPLEMLFNGEGGSVVSYKKNGTKISAVREVIDGEEQVVRDLRPLQAGMLHAVPHLARYIRLHGLLADDLRGLARNLTLDLIENPPTAVSDLFARLTHNETFGTGLVDEVGNEGKLSGIGDLNSAREVHFCLEQWLREVRWKQGAVRQTKIMEWWQQAPRNFKNSAPLEIARVYSPAVNKVIGERLAIYVPSVLKASGGHRTIFNVTKRLAEMGLEPYVFLDGVGEGLHVAEEYLTGTRARLHSSWRHPISSTVAFATIAHSAEFVSKSVNSQHKFYLVQDAEALFNPIGDAYVEGENSYAQNLNHITIGNWLTHVIRSQYQASANPAGLGVDTANYQLQGGSSREFAVCMLFQPEKPRRGNFLALAALEILKKRHPALRIYLYGSDRPAKINFEAEQLGVITNLAELNSLYNRCRSGICISLSNPSRIPFEMMAAGCLPVDVFRYNNLMDHEGDMAILAYQSANSIALALDIALTKNDGTTNFATCLAEQAKRRTLNWELDTVVGNVLSVVEGTSLNESKQLQRTYHHEPIIDRREDLSSAEAFCNWQVRLTNTL